MNAAIDIRQGDLETVREILARFLPADAHVWVFGSRATGAAGRASDLDLIVDAGRSLTLDESAMINVAFDDSDLPYTVDVVDWTTVSDGFRKLIEPGRLPLDFAGTRVAPA